MTFYKYQHFFNEITYQVCVDKPFVNNIVLIISAKSD